MKLTVPPFSFDREPTPGDVARQLVCALPEPERNEAIDLLVRQILPVKLAGMDTHPRPERLVAVAYKEIARALSAQPPNMRLHALKLYAIHTEIQRMSRDAVNLAIARFLFDNTGTLDAEKLERWLTDPVQDLRMLTGAELARRVHELRAALERWKQQIASDYRTEWEKHRVKYLQVRATLDAADSAAFDAACGGLYEFLRDADRQPTELTFD